MKKITSFLITFLFLFSITVYAIPKEVIKKSNAVVYLETYINNEPCCSGSGFIVTANGKLITNYHVIDGATSVHVTTNDNKIYNVKGVYDYSVKQDIAVLQLENASGLSVVKLGDSASIKSGQDIVAIGSPIGLKNTISDGIVSNIRENFREGLKDIQITAPISHGSSGGALFNNYGDVIGITYAGISEGQNINFAIPINEVKPLLKSTKLKTFEEVKKEVYKTNEANKLKFYSKICEAYHSLYILSDSLKDYREDTQFLFETISLNKDFNKQSNEELNYLNEICNNYNTISVCYENLIEEAKKYNIDISDIKTILDKCNTSLDYYYKVLENLDELYANNKDEDFNKYLNNREKASYITLDALDMCNKGYYKYFYKIQLN